MKRTLSIFMICIVLLGNLGEVGVWLNFKLNQDWIAKTLCINRDKPEKGCNGKCHLKAQLKQQEEKDAQLPMREAEETSWVLYTEAEVVTTVELPPIIKVYPQAQDQHLPESPGLLPPFQPPEQGFSGRS